MCKQAFTAVTTEYVIELKCSCELVMQAALWWCPYKIHEKLSPLSPLNEYICFCDWERKTFSRNEDRRDICCSCLLLYTEEKVEHSRNGKTDHNKEGCFIAGSSGWTHEDNPWYILLSSVKNCTIVETIVSDWILQLTCLLPLSTNCCGNKRWLHDHNELRRGVGEKEQK